VVVAESVVGRTTRPHHQPEKISVLVVVVVAAVVAAAVEAEGMGKGTSDHKGSRIQEKPTLGRLQRSPRFGSPRMATSYHQRSNVDLG